MKTAEQTVAPPAPRLRDAGWVLVLAAVVTCAVAIRLVFMVVDSDIVPAIGDGKDVATYGFDLSSCLIPRDEMVAAGMPKDGLRAWTDPPFISADEADDLTRKHRGKFLVSGDRVIGVALNGEAKAYPLRILNWHEIVNDHVGGRPVAVTYHPLCDSVAVFDRNVGGETLEFGVSGLLYNSNLLMYDRREGGEGESLWSQLQFRAVCGPAARHDTALDLIPAVLTTWQGWRETHPDTVVLAPGKNEKKRYKRDPYVSYFATDSVRFPVNPMPPDDRTPLKALPLFLVGQLVIFGLGVPWLALSADLTVAQALEKGFVPFILGGLVKGAAAAALLPAAWRLAGR